MGLSNSSARSPIPRAGHHASSLFQAASILPRPIRAFHRDHEVRRWLLSVEPWSQRLLHHFRPAGAHAGRPLLPHRPPSIVRAMLDAIFSEPCFPAVMHLRQIEVSQTIPHAWSSFLRTSQTKSALPKQLVATAFSSLWYQDQLSVYVLLLVGASGQVPVQFRCSSPTALQRFASSRIGSRSGVVRYDKISGCPSASFNRYEDQYDEGRR
nr:uncharacterized protein LOC127307401 isoform X2 [Lolium perenne]